MCIYIYTPTQIYKNNNLSINLDMMQYDAIDMYPYAKTKSRSKHYNYL